MTRSGLPRGHGELILVVDDEKSIRTIAVKTLSRFGYRVLEAGNGAEAVALYVQHQHEVALVLTDVSMPVMDGEALITALRSFSSPVRIVVRPRHSVRRRLRRLLPRAPAIAADHRHHDPGQRDRDASARVVVTSRCRG